MDVVFIYKFDFRIPQSPPLYGKIRLSVPPSSNHLPLPLPLPLLEEIKPIIIRTINNSGKTWELDYEDIMVSIISVIHSNIIINENSEEFMFPIFIDIRNPSKPQYFYEGEPVYS